MAPYSILGRGSESELLMPFFVTHLTCKPIHSMNVETDWNVQCILDRFLYLLYILFLSFFFFFLTCISREGATRGRQCASFPCSFINSLFIFTYLTVCGVLLTAVICEFVYGPARLQKLNCTSGINKVFWTWIWIISNYISLTGEIYLHNEYKHLKCNIT